MHLLKDGEFMSFDEYQDMYEKCQDYAPYHMFLYDLKNSKQITDPRRQQQLKNLLYHVYHKIEKLEQKTHQVILHRSPLFSSHSFGYLQEPFLIDGDTIGFTVLRGQIDEELVDFIFEETKKELQIPYEFHKAHGFYETDEYAEGNHLYFRGYLIQELNTKHKKKFTK